MLQTTVADLGESGCRVDHVQLGAPKLSHRSGRFETKVSGECHLTLTTGPRIAFVWAATGISDDDSIHFSVGLAQDPVFSLQGICLVDEHAAPLTWAQEREALIGFVGNVDWHGSVQDAISRALT